MSDPRFILEEGHQRLVRARHGYVLYNRNDTVIGRSIEVYGEYFESEVNVFRRLLPPGGVALDIGANIGSHTLAMARLAGPGGFVFAFEPQRLVFQTLCANVALNSLDNVHCVNAAVGDQPALLSISDPDPQRSANFGGAMLDMLTVGPKGAPVPQVAVDGFVDVTRLDLVKVDVEGMEAAVLRGARATLARFMPALYVENAFPERSPELLSMLRDAGYHCHWHLPRYVGRNNHFGSAAQLYPVAFVDRGDTHLDAIGFAVNVLCVPATGPQVTGLRPVASPLEHPFRRECVDSFARLGSDVIPVIRE